MKRIFKTVFGMGILISSNLYAQSEVKLKLLEKYFIGQPVSKLFTSHGGEFTPVQGKVCKNYPNCPENFRKYWMEPCLQRVITAGVSPKTKEIEVITDQWAGKCNAYGDAPTFEKFLSSEEPQPTWIERQKVPGGRPTDFYNGYWLVKGGYVSAIGYCENVLNGNKIKNFKSCYVSQITINVTQGAIELIKPDMKKNDLPW